MARLYGTNTYFNISNFLIKLTLLFFDVLSFWVNSAISCPRLTIKSSILQQHKDQKLDVMII